MDIEPWVQFVLLYFFGGAIIGALVRGIVRTIRPYDSKLLAYLALVVLVPLVFSPLALGAYFTYFHIDGWWNLALWLAVFFQIAWLANEISGTAQEGV